MPAASWQMAARALPRAGAVSLLGTMLAAVDYLNVPFLSGSAQFHAKRPQPSPGWARFLFGRGSGPPSEAPLNAQHRQSGVWSLGGVGISMVGS